MAGYWKKIVYLDYLENGMKIKNAGFVRLEEKEGQMRLEMRVKDIPEVFEGQYELRADTGGAAGRISLRKGSGGCCVVWKTGKEAAGDKRLVQANGIYVRLPGRHLLQAVWQEPVALWVEAEAVGREAAKPEDDGAKAVESVNRGTEDSGAAADEPEAAETAEGEAGAGCAGQETADAMSAGREAAANSCAEAEEACAAAAALPEELPKKESLQKELPPEETRQEGNRQKEPVCYGDKWEQLTHMYSVIHPFRDGREYLSIAPKDFVVLRSEYQKMVHNSFLLHGYYNYRHLILGRIEENGEMHFYLGVPGNFYGREKMVAEMFGFEAFEGERQPAKAGDFGYFMKRVEI